MGIVQSHFIIYYADTGYTKKLWKCYPCISLKTSTFLNRYLMSTLDKWHLLSKLVLVLSWTWRFWRELWIFTYTHCCLRKIVRNKNNELSLQYTHNDLELPFVNLIKNIPVTRSRHIYSFISLQFCFMLQIVGIFFYIRHNQYKVRWCTKKVIWKEKLNTADFIIFLMINK